MFGGEDATGTVLGDMWEFRFATATWKQIEVSAAVSRVRHVCVHACVRVLAEVLLASRHLLRTVPMTRCWAHYRQLGRIIPSLPLRLEGAWCCLAGMFVSIVSLAALKQRACAVVSLIVPQML
jgi:hypothetical protein